MSEYWKSTPRYWCKYCKVYVRDSALERGNHEATMTHQNGVKRALREIHRGHERDEGEKERAKAEVERLERLVSGKKGPGPASRPAAAGWRGVPHQAAGPPPYVPPGAPAERTAAGAGAGAGEGDAERKRRLEELAGLGVEIPPDLRGDMAIPGEWTVTSERVVEEREEGDVTRRAVGVRKREMAEEDREEEEAIRGLNKKRRGWGVGVKRMPGERDDALEELLMGDLGGEVKREVKLEGGIKEEGGAKTEEVKTEEVGNPPDKLAIKEDPEDGTGMVADVAPAKETTGDGAPVPVFKKRKPKNIRQK